MTCCSKESKGEKRVKGVGVDGRRRGGSGRKMSYFLEKKQNNKKKTIVFELQVLGMWWGGECQEQRQGGAERPKPGRNTSGEKVDGNKYRGPKLGAS